MNYCARVRASLAESRDAGWPWAEAWAVVLDEDPLDEFMGGYFIDGRDSEGNDFPEWFETLFRTAYEGRAFSGAKKPTRLNPYGDGTEAVRSVPVASQAPLQRDIPVTVAVARCRFGGGCDQPATHGRFGQFCAEHFAVLSPMREAFELSEAERDPMRQRIAA